MNNFLTNGLRQGAGDDEVVQIVIGESNRHADVSAGSTAHNNPIQTAAKQTANGKV